MHIIFWLYGSIIFPSSLSIRARKKHLQSPLSPPPNSHVFHSKACRAMGIVSHHWIKSSVRVTVLQWYMTESQCKLAQVQNEIYWSTYPGRARVILRSNGIRKLNVFRILSTLVFYNFPPRLFYLHFRAIRAICMKDMLLVVLDSH